MVTDFGTFFATGGLAASANRPRATKSKSVRCFFTRESLLRRAGVPPALAERLARRDFDGKVIGRGRPITPVETPALRAKKTSASCRIGDRGSGSSRGKGQQRNVEAIAAGMSAC